MQACPMPNKPILDGVMCSLFCHTMTDQLAGRLPVEPGDCGRPDGIARTLAGILTAQLEGLSTQCGSCSSCCDKAILVLRKGRRYTLHKGLSLKTRMMVVMKETGNTGVQGGVNMLAGVTCRFISELKTKMHKAACKALIGAAVLHLTC